MNIFNCVRMRKIALIYWFFSFYFQFIPQFFIIQVRSIHFCKQLCHIEFWSNNTFFHEWTHSFKSYSDHWREKWEKILIFSSKSMSARKHTLLYMSQTFLIKLWNVLLVLSNFNLSENALKSTHLSLFAHFFPRQISEKNVQRMHKKYRNLQEGQKNLEQIAK